MASSSSLTVAIASYNYGEYLRRAIETAIEFGDEVLVYDDCSTDDSWDIIREYPVKAYRAVKNTGDALLGFNRAIDEAFCDYLTLLDADNWLLRRPELAGDYTFASIDLYDERGKFDQWCYDCWPKDAHGCLDIFAAKRTQPLPSGGCWNLAWVRKHGLKLLKYQTSAWAYDVRTHVEWLKHDPHIVWLPEPFLAFRWHPGQLTQNKELEALARDELMAIEVVYPCR